MKPNRELPIHILSLEDDAVCEISQKTTPCFRVRFRAEDLIPDERILSATELGRILRILAQSPHR